MRLTQHTDYALRVLIYLGHKQDSLSTIQEIAEAYQISRNHLMKVVRQLVSIGYVESVRGVGGGIRLCQPPEHINLAQVIQNMEPDAGLVECARPDNACVITSSCVLPGILGRALSAFWSELANHTLADLLPESRRDTFRTQLGIDAIDVMNIR